MKAQIAGGKTIIFMIRMRDSPRDDATMPSESVVGSEKMPDVLRMATGGKSYSMEERSKAADEASAPHLAFPGSAGAAKII